MLRVASILGGFFVRFREAHGGRGRGLCVKDKFVRFLMRIQEYSMGICRMRMAAPQNGALKGTKS